MPNPIILGIRFSVCEFWGNTIRPQYTLWKKNPETSGRKKKKKKHHTVLCCFPKVQSSKREAIRLPCWSICLWVKLNHIQMLSVQFSLVAKSYLTLCDPIDCSTPGFPVHHQLPEFTQTHVLWVVWFCLIWSQACIFNALRIKDTV